MSGGFNVERRRLERVETLTFKLPEAIGELQTADDRRWRTLFVPPKEDLHRAHQLEFGWQNSLGMTILGLVGVLYAVACCLAVWLRAGSAQAQLSFFGVAMGLTGLVALFASRTGPGRRYARLLVAALLLSLSVVVNLEQQPTAAGFALTSLAAQLPMLLVLTVGLMAYRPLQTALLALVVVLISLAGALLRSGGFDDRALSLVIYTLLLGSGAVVFGTLLYRLRWGIVDRRLEQLRQRDYFQKRTTQLEQKNRELKKQRAHVLDQAQSSQLKSLSQIAAGLAHEINTPVGTIYSNIDLVDRAASNLKRAFDEHQPRSNAADRKTQRSFQVLDETLPRMRRAVRRVSGIVQNLESFAQLDRAAGVPCDLREALESALAMLRYRFNDAIALERDYGEVPKVVADSQRLHQAFLNVLTNAVQAVEDKGRGTVRVSTERQQGHVVVRIRDNGSGIASGDLSRVFDPGFTTRGVGVGIGLGLSIAYRIIEDHGGQLEISSELHKGTEVAVWLPARGGDQKAPWPELAS
jgi:signal transduction histidine kinase